MAGADGRFDVARSAPAVARRRSGRRQNLDSEGAPVMGGTMASPMTPPPHAPDFLAASGWRGAQILPLAGDASRSEERRVGKECRSRWSPDRYKKKEVK